MSFPLHMDLQNNPFRLFFPLGLAAGLLGVGHWVVWTIGIPVDNIKSLHLTLQSQGFLALFVVGFLLTGFPRFSGTAPADPLEIFMAFLGAVVFLFAELRRNWDAAQIGFLVMIVTLPIFALRRLPQRTKELPPSFLLLGFGFVHALLGGVFSLWSHMGETHWYWFSVGRQMVQVGFLLCMVLGITAKLAPFLLGYTDDPACEETSSVLCLSRRGEMITHGLVGAFLLGSFVLEPVHPRFAALLRAVLVTAHLLRFAKIGRPLRKRTTTMFFFWLSCWMIPVGLWLAGVLPLYRVAALHVVFIGGFSLMIFSFGLLIVLSHGGRAALLNGKLWAMKVVGGMVLLALTFRLLADFWPKYYMAFLHSAGGFWVVAAGVWLGYTLPKMKSASYPH